MAFTVRAETVRALVPDGTYVLQGLEQRPGHGVVLTFTLPARAGGYTLQIETTEDKARQLFEALLVPPPSRRSPRRRATPASAPEAAPAPRRRRSRRQPVDAPGA
ncbi:MAG: hypothetical protein KatS3mg131_0893 [Candidatus Tectimicrobiota bacterium]|nr:MAG: hypothetical protein KatS3mg131_0893 [Candidatus Tectomicrobia bacterium]